jgi:hypothetical protein
MGTAYIYNTLPKAGVSLTLNGPAAGYAAPASYGSPSLFHFLRPPIDGQKQPMVLSPPGTNTLVLSQLAAGSNDVLAQQTYTLELPFRIQSQEDLWLFVFPQQIIVVDSFSGTLMTMTPEPLAPGTS